MSGLLSTLKVVDVPENKVDKLRAIAVVGEVEEKEVANGYVAISIPLTFNDEKSGDERTFTARFNVKPEWFEAGFDSSSLEDKEKISFQINMSRNVRGLFKSAGLESIDFDALQGERVGFSAGPRKDDPSRLELKGFFTPKA
jgi:hypothetical protein